MRVHTCTCEDMQGHVPPCAPVHACVPSQPPPPPWLTSPHICVPRCSWPRVPPPQRQGPAQHWWHHHCQQHACGKGGGVAGGRSSISGGGPSVQVVTHIHASTQRLCNADLRALAAAAGRLCPEGRVVLLTSQATHTHPAAASATCAPTSPTDQPVHPAAASTTCAPTSPTDQPVHPAAASTTCAPTSPTDQASPAWVCVQHPQQACLWVPAAPQQANHLTPTQVHMDVHQRHGLTTATHGVGGLEGRSKAQTVVSSDCTAKQMLL
jgi:hypothetical protein